MSKKIRSAPRTGNQEVDLALKRVYEDLRDLFLEQEEETRRNIYQTERSLRREIDVKRQSSSDNQLKKTEEPQQVIFSGDLPDTTNADVGDVLKLGSGKVPTWLEDEVGIRNLDPNGSKTSDCKVVDIVYNAQTKTMQVARFTLPPPNVSLLDSNNYNKDAFVVTDVQVSNGVLVVLRSPLTDNSAPTLRDINASIPRQQDNLRPIRLRGDSSILGASFSITSSNLTFDPPMGLVTSLLTSISYTFGSGNQFNFIIELTKNGFNDLRLRGTIPAPNQPQLPENDPNPQEEA